MVACFLGALWLFFPVSLSGPQRLVSGGPGILPGEGVRLPRGMMQPITACWLLGFQSPIVYSKRKTRNRRGLRASWGHLKSGPLRQTGLSGAEANLPEARAHILLAQLPHLIQERGFQTEECSYTRSSLFPRQDDLSGILKVTSL